MMKNQRCPWKSRMRSVPDGWLACERLSLQGALGRGWELRLPAQNCNGTLFPCGFCFSSGLHGRTLLLGSCSPILGKVQPSPLSYCS